MNLFHHRFDDFRSRSVLKVITWRVLVSITNFFGGWLSSGSWKVGLGVVSFALVVNSFAYFVHERAWNLLDWGRDIDRGLHPQESPTC